MSSVGNIDVQIRADIRNLQSGLQQMRSELNSSSRNIQTQTRGISSSFRSMASNIAMSIQGLIIYKGLDLLTSGIKSTIATFTDMESATLGLSSILSAQGRSFAGANEYIQSYIQDGLVPLSDAITAYKSLTARGYNDTQIKDTLNRLKDAAAFGRQSSLSIGDAVRGAAEGLKNENSMLVDNAGITKNVAKMWDEYAKSIGKNAQQLSMQEKIQAEVNGIMKESQFQVGDAAKYADTLGGKLAALGAQFTMLKGAIGSIFAPALEAILPSITAMTVYLTQAAQAAGSFMRQLFGIKAPTESTKAATKAQVELSKAVGKAGKKASENLQGFDELNTIQKEIAESSDDIADAITTEGASTNEPPSVTTTMTDMVSPAVETIKQSLASLQKAYETVKTALEGAFGGTLSTAISTIGTSFTNLGTTLTNFKDTIWSIFKTSVLEYLKTTDWTTNINNLNGAIENMGLYISGVIDYYNEMIRIIDEVTTKNFELITSSVGNFFKGVTDLWTSLVYLETAIPKDAIEVFNTVLKNISDTITNTFDLAIKLVMETIDGLGTLFTTTGEGMKKVYDDNIGPLKELFVDVFTTVGDLFGSLVENVIEPVLLPAFESISSVVAEVMPEIWANVSSVFGNIIEILKKFWEGTIKPMVEWISKEFLPRMKPSFTELGLVFKDVFSSAMGLVKDLTQILKGLTEFLSGVFTADWTKIWNGVSDIFGGVFRGLVNIARVPLNSIIRMINTFLDSLSSIKITIPKVNIPGIGEMGGGTIGFPKLSINEIPALADGGIATGATVAMIGEGQYDEAVLPLGGSKFDGLINGIANAVVTALSVLTPQESSGSSQELVINISGTEVARAILPDLNKEQNRRGLNAIVRGV